MDVKPSTETVDWESLSPACTRHTDLRGFICDQPAVWWMRWKCCGRVSYSCNQHYTEVMTSPLNHQWWCTCSVLLRPVQDFISDAGRL